jgi:hypothetical protein
MKGCEQFSLFVSLKKSNHGRRLYKFERGIKMNSDKILEIIHAKLDMCRAELGYNSILRYAAINDKNDELSEHYKHIVDQNTACVYTLKDLIHTIEKFDADTK